MPLGAERSREREVHRYYQVWVESSRGYLSPENISRDDPLLHEDGPRHQEAIQRISRDKALVAFAQLGCLRLNVKRGIVTLISSTTSYILAEATRTISLLSGGQHAAGDELWFGTASIPRNQGFSEHALEPPIYTARSSDGQSYSAPALVVEDMTMDSRSSGKLYVDNGTLFYAGVPIVTKNGFTIGVYTVTDDKPRHDGLTPEELHFLLDIASTIMDHLENILNDNARRRGERMVLGLGAFTEGQATMDTKEDSTVLPHEISSLGSRSTVYKGITITETDPNALRNTLSRESSSSPDRRHSDAINSANSANSALVDWSNRPLDVSGPPSNQHANVPKSIQESTGVTSSASNRQNTSRISTDAEVEESLAAKGSKTESALPFELRQTFARAANILRQCTGSDGVMFFDAQSANVGNDYRANSTADQNDRSDGRTSSEEIMSTSSSGGSSDDSGQHENDYFSRPKAGHKPSKAENCKKLGYSFRLLSVAKTSGAASGMVLKESEMRRFIRQYPKGLVMHYTKEGEVSSSDESSSRDRIDTGNYRPGMTINQKEKKHVIAKELIKVVPGARNVIFLPMWDFSKAQWTAGCFVWSSRPERLLMGQNDLIFFRAFANTIMGEVNRLEAVSDAQNKTSFVANISHELRSPLHGILGSIEFLQDTAVDPFQASMITTVETCGKTLLDTVNSVLEFSKLSKGSVKVDLRRLGGKETSTLAHVENIDLATTIEEVVEAIYAGQTFRSTGAFHGAEDDVAMSPDIDPPPPKRMSIHRTHSKFSGAVRLLLDIDRMDSWCVRTQPGAVRRIVMNLLGNSLKYTERGLVCVSLQPTKGSSRNKSSLSFCITVADTGKGMSTDFARHHAWEAFSQEDSFASGVGLGLSIVRYIAASLGGKIDLQSSVGKGTEIKILLTMPLGSAKEDETRNVVDLVGKSTHGLRLCMLDPGYASIHHGDADVNRRAVDTLQRMASSWFGMEVFKSPTIQGVQADFFMYVEPPSIEHLLQHHGLGTENTHVPLIMITPNAFESAALRNDTLKLKELGRTIDIISQPCGPQKLARALERCIYGEPSVTPSDIANTSLAGLRIDKGIRDTVFTPQHQSSSDFPDTRAPKPGLKRQDSFNPEPDVSSAGSEPPTDALSESVGASALIRFNTIHGTPSSTGDDKGSGTNRNPDRNPVLLVDDNEVNLRILCAFVRKAGFQYETAKDGLQALELYKKFNKDPKLASFEVIVMDVQMPVMDGVTATRKIRTYESRNRIKPATIVALTGLASEASRNECEKAGVDHFLSKPVKFKEFLKLLESVS